MRIRARKQRFPLARVQGLLMEEVDSEKVIFDEQTKQAHCLTPIAAVVIDHCDGETSPAELARIAGNRLGEPVNGGQIEQALAQLEERSLLVSPLPVTVSRREMVRKSAAYGAAAAAATMIFTIEPPIASAASPCTSHNCSTNADCSQAANPCTSGTCTSCNTAAGKCQCVH